MSGSSVQLRSSQLSDTDCLVTECLGQVPALGTPSVMSRSQLIPSPSQYHNKYTPHLAAMLLSLLAAMKTVWVYGINGAKIVHHQMN